MDLYDAYAKLIRWARAPALILSVVVLATAAQAQTYPTKQVRVLTGYPPGGPTDIIGHVLTQYLTTTLGQTFYLEGKPGAAGVVAGGILANSPPDGSTLYVVGLGLVAVNADLYSDMPYDPAKAFAPITLLVNLPVVLEVNAKLPVNSLKDFIAYAKTGAQLNHGSPGIGTVPHLAAELFKARVGFQSAHVAYKGTGPFANGMMSGEVQWSFDVPNTAITLLKGGYVKLLGITSAKPYPNFPNTPTFVQLGMPDFVFTTWFALVAPAKTPRAIIDRLHDAIAKGWQDPKVVAPLLTAGLDPQTTTPEQTAKIFADDRARWGAVVRENHIKAE